MQELREVYQSEVFYLEEGTKGPFIAKGAVECLEADVENANKRTYTFPVVKKAISEFNKKLEDSKVLGQLDHPKSSVHTELPNVSHVLTKCWMEDKKVFAELGILNTSKGKDTLSILKSGCDLGMSLRGFGNVVNGVVQDDLVLSSFDIVLNPSFASSKFSEKNLIESYVEVPLTEEQKNIVMHRQYNEAMFSGSKLSFSEFKKLKKKE